MKGRGGNLKTEAHKHHGRAGKQELRISCFIQPYGDLCDVGRAWQAALSTGCAVNESNAVEQEGGRERAQDEIFQRRFV